MRGERSQKVDLRADRLRPGYETKRGELGRIADMQARNEEIVIMVRERLLSIPGECSDVLSPEQVAYVRDKLYDAMEDLSALGSQAEQFLASARSRDDSDIEPDEVIGPRWVVRSEC